jgi:Domain of unknown function (DUF4431)
MMRLLVCVAALVVAAAPACADACLKAEAEGQQAEGRLDRVRFTDVDYGNQVEVAYILNLAKPACLNGDDEYDKVKSTLKIHVFSMDKAMLAQLSAAVGRRIRVTGSAFGEHTRHHRAPIVMGVTAMQRLP